MTTNTQPYNPVRAATPGVGGLIRLVGAIVLIVIIAGWLLSSYRAGTVITVNEPLPAAQTGQDPEVVRVSTNDSDVVKFAIQGTDDFIVLNVAYDDDGSVTLSDDAEGDYFQCAKLPQDLHDLQQLCHRADPLSVTITKAVRQAVEDAVYGSGVR